MFYDPYRMVLIGLFSFSLLVLGTFFYRFIKPKKKVNLLFLLILFSILPTLSIFRTGVYESGDFTLHIYRGIDFFNNLKEGILFPSWAGMLNATYGYDLFIFINPFPYYVISLLHIVTSDFVVSMKLLLALSFVLSGVFMYFWMKKMFQSSFAAFTAGIFYLFAPYHLVDLHFRVAIGEVLIFVFLPLLSLCTLVVNKKPQIKNVLLLSIITFLTILSHQAMAVFCIGFVIIYEIFLLLTTKTPKIKSLGAVLCGIILGIGMSWYALWPYIALGKYTIASTYTVVNFPKIWEVLFSPFRFGFLFQGPHGELSTIIGYSQLLVVGVTCFALFKFKKNKFTTQQKFWLGSFFLYFFMILPISAFFWKVIPFISLAAISTRLLLFVVLVTSVLAGILAMQLKKQKILVWIFIFLSVFITILNWGNRKMVTSITSNYLISNVWQATSKGEGWGIGVTKWRPYFGWEGTLPKNSLEIIQGSGKIQNISNTEVSHTYIVDGQSSLLLRHNTWYFPGWHVTLDKKGIKIDFAKKENNGLIVFSIPKGKHAIDVFYEDVPSLKTAKIFSEVLTALVLFGLILCLFFGKKRLY